MRSASMSLFRHFHENQAGNIGVAFAFAFMPVMVGAGSAIDYARAASAKTSLQALVDAAALAGAGATDTSDAGRRSAAMAFFPSQDSQDRVNPNLTANPTVNVSILG